MAPEGDQGKGKKLGIVMSFKYMYLGAVLYNDSKPKVLSRFAHAPQLLQRGCQFGEIATYSGTSMARTSLGP